MQPVYIIRPEQDADIPFVRALNDEAFRRPDEGRLVDAVRRRREPTFCLVATEAVEDDGADVLLPPIGHILFSPVSIDCPGRSCKAVGLGPVAVHPRHQRAGVGRQLIERGLEKCRDEGYEAVVLLGHPTYYARFGFVMASTRGLHWEHEMPGDPFMVLELRPGGLDGVTGVVRYLPEFLTV